MSTSNQYKLFLSPTSSKARVAITPTGAAKKNVIYQIHNEDTGDSYVGSTERTFEARIKEHASDITSKSRSISKAHKVLRKALKENQEVFASILEEVPANKSLSEKEKNWIASLEPSLNSTLGGRAKKPKQQEISEEPSKTTPEKNYDFREQAGKVTVDWTPSARKADDQAIIYRIKNKKTNECYVGQTTQSLANRVKKHIHLANQPQNSTAKRRLYQEMSEDPEAFTVGIVTKVAPQELDAAERALILEKDSQRHGYNCNQGNLPGSKANSG